MGNSFLLDQIGESRENKGNVKKEEIYNLFGKYSLVRYRWYDIFRVWPIPTEFSFEIIDKSKLMNPPFRSFDDFDLVIYEKDEGLSDITDTPQPISLSSHTFLILENNKEYTWENDPYKYIIYINENCIKEFYFMYQGELKGGFSLKENKRG
jgi:hypothetical protein